MVRCFVLVATIALLSRPALAQSTYVAGVMGADLTLVSHSESDLYPSPTPSSEVWSGGIRVGTSINAVFGVELGFSRSGTTNGEGLGIYPAYATTTFVGLPIGGIPIEGISIPVDYQLESKQQRSSLDAVVFVRQPVGDSVDLVYLGGIAFMRESTEVAQSYILPARPIVQPRVTRSTFVTYATRPLVGIEGRIAMTEHLRLVPGIRMTGLADGWILRPSVGLSWLF